MCVMWHGCVLRVKGLRLHILLFFRWAWLAKVRASFDRVIQVHRHGNNEDNHKVVQVCQVRIDEENRLELR